MNRKYLACLISVWIMIFFMIPTTVSGQKIPKINPAKQGTRIVNKLLTRGQRWVKRSVRELRKKKDIPLEEKEIREQFKVIGTEPSWLVYNRSFENEYYFNLLTDLVIGEYDIDPESGGYRNEKSFKALINRRAILDSAYSMNAELGLLIRLTYAGDYGPPELRKSLYEDFLQTSGVHRILADSLTSGLVMDDGVNLGPSVGIIVDFHDIPVDQADAYFDFLRLMRNRLGGSLYISLPGTELSSSVYSPKFVKDILSIVDGFLLQGYGYERADTLSSGSAIQQKGPHDIQRAVDHYLNQVKIPAEKLLVEFSYFGTAWEKKGGRFQQRNHRPLVPFDQISVPPNKIRAMDDEMSLSAEGKDGFVYTFDDEATLSKKYEWVKETGLGGIGIYGLGYYSKKGGEKPWVAISSGFSSDPPQTVYPALAFLLMFFGFGIFVSVIQYWQVRNEIARKRRHQWFYGLSMMMIGIVILCCMIPLIPPEATAGSSTLMIMFPFLRRFRSMFRKWGLA